MKLGEREMPRNLVDIEPVAQHFGVTAKTVRGWVSDGIIPAYRMGGHRLRFDLDEVEAAILTPVPAVKNPATRPYTFRPKHSPSFEFETRQES